LWLSTLWQGARTRPKPADAYDEFAWQPANGPNFFGGRVLQYWSQRALQTPLSKALATAPSLQAIGIDETTAALVPDGQLEVVGEGHVGIYDGSDDHVSPNRN